MSEDKGPTDGRQAQRSGAGADADRAPRARAKQLGLSTASLKKAVASVSPAADSTPQAEPSR